VEVQVAVKTQRGAPRSRLGKRPAHFCQGELWTTVEVEQEAPASREAYDFGHSALLLAYVVIFGFFIDISSELSTGDPVATF
jgi:hypothetical protein